jgi:hypothetical protein
VGRSSVWKFMVDTGAVSLCGKYIESFHANVLGKV